MVTVDEAAERLRVSVRQVQRLVRDGNLIAVGPNRLDWESVLRHEVSHQGHSRRAWTEPTAWAAIATLTGVGVDWLGQAQRSRLKSELRKINAEELVGRTRNRARVRRLSGHRSVISRIAGEVVRSGAHGHVGELSAAADERIDGYVAPGRSYALIDRYRLTDAATCNVILRVTEFDLDVVSEIASMANVLAGLDLSTSLDARERTAGHHALRTALEKFRDS